MKSKYTLPQLWVHLTRYNISLRCFTACLNTCMANLHLCRTYSKEKTVNILFSVLLSSIKTTWCSDIIKTTYIRFQISQFIAFGFRYKDQLAIKTTSASQMVLLAELLCSFKECTLTFRTILLLWCWIRPFIVYMCTGITDLHIPRLCEDEKPLWCDCLFNLTEKPEWTCGMEITDTTSRAWLVWGCVRHEEYNSVLQQAWWAECASQGLEMQFERYN